MRQKNLIFQKEKRRKWIFVGRLKTKKLPSITAPPQSKETTTLNEAEEEQKKHALTVAIASAAAVTAAHVAVAEVVRLTGVSQSSHQCHDNSQESQPVKTSGNGGAPQSIYQCQREIEESAAIKIQTSFRGYLVSLSKLISSA